MKKLTPFLVLGVVVLAGSLVLGFLSSGATALAAGSQPNAAVTAQVPTANQDQAPTYTGSIQVPNPQDRAENNRGENEAVEAGQLAGLAKITATEGKAAALQAVPGEATKVALDNENGSLVYSVEVKKADGTVADVKVDAGTTQILSIDAGQDKEGPEGTEVKGAQEKEKVHDSSADKDTVQLEEEGEH